MTETLLCRAYGNRRVGQRRQRLGVESAFVLRLGKAVDCDDRRAAQNQSDDLQSHRDLPRSATLSACSINDPLVMRNARLRAADDDEQPREGHQHTAPRLAWISRCYRLEVTPEIFLA